MNWRGGGWQSSGFSSSVETIPMSAIEWRAVEMRRQIMLKNKGEERLFAALRVCFISLHLLWITPESLGRLVLPSALQFILQSLEKFTLTLPCRKLKTRCGWRLCKVKRIPSVNLRYIIEGLSRYVDMAVRIHIFWTGYHCKQHNFAAWNYRCMFVS